MVDLSKVGTPRFREPIKMMNGARPEILLCPNIPKPLHGVNPRILFGSIWWDQERKRAYAASGFRCAACWIHKAEAKFHPWLEGHELYEYDYPNGRLTYIETVALCHSCHNFIHSGRMETLCLKGEISDEKYAAIMEHGHEVLSRINIDMKQIHHTGACAKWEDWRLVYKGVEYPPIHQTFEEWQKHYGS